MKLVFVYVAILHLMKQSSHFSNSPMAIVKSIGYITMIVKDALTCISNGSRSELVASV